MQTPAHIVARRLSSRTIAHKASGRELLGPVTSEEQRVLDAVTLFTVGHVGAVRDVRYFSVQGTRSIRGIRVNGKSVQVTPSSEAYANAGAVMRELAQATRTNAHRVYRGISLPSIPVVGDVFDLGDVTSWSSNRALAFSWGRDSSATSRARVLLEMMPKRGTDISLLSKFPESEFVTGGIVRVTHVRHSIDIDGVVTIEQI